MSSSSTPLERRVSPVHRFAGAALAALDRVGDAPAWAMTPDEQVETLAELAVVRARLEELELRTLAAADRNQVGDKTGAANTAAWLAVRTRETRSDCHARLRLARALDEAVFAPTREALASGAVNVAQARVIVAAIEDLPAGEVGDEQRVRGQRHLVALAADFDAKTLRRLGRRLFDVLAPEEADRREGEKLAEQERRARERARFSMRDHGDGTTSGSFKMPTAQAHMLAKALEAIAAPRRRAPGDIVDAAGKRASYAVLLGQAFADLVERLPLDKLPQSGGLAATVVVTTSLETLRTGLGKAVLDTGEDISASAVRRMSCTAGLMPMVLGGESVPLDLGRKARLASTGQRVVLAARDGGCTAEDCDRPPGWAEAHHDRPWAEGGQTNIEDLRLLCPHHHHLAHDDRYATTVLPDNQVRFHRRT